MNEHIRALAERIWHYHQMNHQLEKADAILVLCSHEYRICFLVWVSYLVVVPDPLG